MLGTVNQSSTSQPKRAFDAELRESARANLAKFERQSQPDPNLRPAAVAIIITSNEIGEACFLITRRSAGLRRHSHQWALPGGRLDAGESVIEAALRETREEIGLHLEPTDVLGLLDDFATRSGFRMTPIVAWAAPGQTLRPDPAEVEQLHFVPLTELEKPNVPILEEIPESDRPVLSVPILGQQIYTPTASILYQLREVVLAGRSTRVAHFEQPLFAWK